MLRARIDAAWAEHDSLARSLPVLPGRVFTPRALALQLAERTLAPFIQAPQVIDPACGAGALLLGAIEFAAMQRPQWLESWALDGIQGWELDGATAAGANSILRRALGGVSRDFVSTQDGLAECGQTFDAVLANPPWVSFSGRQAAPITAARRADLARRYAAFRGWPGLHAAFCEQAARLAPAGRIGLLLPLQVADLASYAPARQALTARHGLECVIDLGERAFAGVTEPSGMFILGGGPPGWLVATDHDLLHMARRFAPLPAQSFGDIGVHSGNAAKLIVKTRPGRGLRPLRVGTDVRAFTLAEACHWLSDAPLPAGTYARRPGPEVFARARILLRQTADRPIAARHTPVTAFRNSVLACFGTAGHDDDYLLGVLNSDLMAAIHRAMFRDARQKAFPQVKIAHLRALPFPGREIGPAYGRVAALARKIQAGERHLLPQLELAVRAAFGLSP